MADAGAAVGDATENAGCSSASPLALGGDGTAQHAAQNQCSVLPSNSTNNSNNGTNTATIVLGRKLIHSHHIIAKSKRRAISDLAKDYQLGGYFKIGWPGIIVIEGREEHCNAFCDEIRSMRWQYLVVRGEERETVPIGGGSGGDDDNDNGNNRNDNVNTNADSELQILRLNKLRRFPLQMTELGEDQMSHLSEICRQAGLEDLFLTSMKIYNRQGGSNDNNHGDGNGNSNSNNCKEQHESSPSSSPSSPRYGTLILVDHMNDPKGYTKWIRKACQSSGCRCAILRHCEHSTAAAAVALKSAGRSVTRRRPIIFVALFANEASSVKQVLKRWRTSRVDVDSKGNPCLERKMDVLVEGELPVCATTTSTAAGATSMDRDNTGDRGHYGKPSNNNNGNDNISSSSLSLHSSSSTMDNNDGLTLDEMEALLDSIGGSSWMETFRGTIQSRYSSNSNNKRATKG